MDRAFILASLNLISDKAARHIYLDILFNIIINLLLFMVPLSFKYTLGIIDMVSGFLQWLCIPLSIVCICTASYGMPYRYPSSYHVLFHAVLLILICRGTVRYLALRAKAWVLVQFQ